MTVWSLSRRIDVTGSDVRIAVVATTPMLVLCTVMGIAFANWEPTPQERCVAAQGEVGRAQMARAIYGQMVDNDEHPLPALPSLPTPADLRYCTPDTGARP